MVLVFMALSLQFFERMSGMYRAQMMDPWWHWYGEDPGPRRALALFAGNYAYERQGRARSYPHAAYLAVMHVSGELDAADIWQAFLAELDRAKSNPKLNPLNHTTRSCSCVRCAFSDSQGQLEDIVDVVHTELVEGRVRDAFDRLDSVRGIGPKIASFFLRDLAIWFKIEPRQRRDLLQPIDVWVHRYVAMLDGGAASRRDEWTANWICEHSAAPEALNQGLWYFSSQIAASQVKLRHALDEEDYASEITERYVAQLRDAVAAWAEQGESGPEAG
jgi:hypothetical protein